MKIRINDLARELEVKSKAILDVLDEVGVIEKKTHSSSLEADDAEKVRKHFAKSAGPAKDGRGAHKAAPAADELKPKFDLSKISKPGDVLKAIQSKAAPGKPAAATAPPTAPSGAQRPGIAQRPAAPPEPPPAIKSAAPRGATVVPASQASHPIAPKAPSAPAASAVPPAAVTPPSAPTTSHAPQAHAPAAPPPTAPAAPVDPGVAGGPSAAPPPAASAPPSNQPPARR